MDQIVKKRTNILFDASILTTRPAVGLVFVAKNILWRLSSNPNYTVTLYFQNYNKHTKKLLCDEFLCRFTFLVDISERFEYIMIKYRMTMAESKNTLKKAWYSLKFIMKYSLLIISRIKNNSVIKESSVLKNNSVLKSTDVFFSPFYSIPFHIKEYSHIRCFIILYDTIPTVLQHIYHPISENDWYNKLLNSLDKETYYFCISECTKKDFFKFFGPKLDESKMFITYIAPSHPLYPLYDRTMLKNVLNKYRILYNGNDKYILSFCSLEPRKNLVFTLKAFCKFIKKHNIQDLYFYLCGAGTKSFVSSLENSIDCLNIYKDKIIRLGYVDNEDVNILYSNALFFTYISKYEGFGLPPLEAMQAGTPVITSDNSSLPEVVGDAAITVDCDSEEQCIKAFEDLYFNEALRNEYIAKGLERAKLFSWEKTVNKMSGIIDNIVN
jgi:glycosyltransferase involved in cell wall biosynthesis